MQGQIDLRWEVRRKGFHRGQGLFVFEHEWYLRKKIGKI
jgi:hypothetical protein